MTARCSRKRRKALPSAPVNARGYPDKRFTLQIAVEDCTGCGICIDHCPAHDPLDPASRRSISANGCRWSKSGRRDLAFFESLPEHAREQVDLHLSRGLQFVRPLFEFSSACAGCGETPYLKLLSQLFGDRLQIANATGCSSIYGGNLPSLPWRAGPTGAVRRGATASSRTTPSSVSACGLRSTSRLPWRAPWSARWPIA